MHSPQHKLESSRIPMRKIFLNQFGLRAGWRLLIFVAIFLALQFATDSILRLVHPRQRSFLDPVGTIYGESQTLVVVLIATWIMSKVEHCSFANLITVFRCARTRAGCPGDWLRLLCSLA
jgi:hypothetical protein